MSPLSLPPIILQLLGDFPGDSGNLCNKAAVLRAGIKERHCALLRQLCVSEYSISFLIGFILDT